jgi:hypothetical protein
MSRNIFYIKCHIIDVFTIYLLLCGMMCGIFSASVFEMLRFVSPGFKRQRNNYLCRSNYEPNVMVACDQLGMVAMKLMATLIRPNLFIKSRRNTASFAFAT